MSLCPICQKPTLHDYRPFCSKRCADVDLGRWFNESYSVPAVDEDEAEKNGFPPLDHRDGLE
ncbi:DNA gyrase inhibitor YacG [Asaia bogorensis]|uniref:DNA gyrase inhibitor YacG n=1 Tax=Asaia bogorensis TaxID=91915 RepID=UPI000EFDAE7A|nr:DNA gyrase inhibitor YacG [Asaia bogorensis]